jgi:hypothetical protein
MCRPDFSGDVGSCSCAEFDWLRYLLPPWLEPSAVQRSTQPWSAPSSKLELLLESQALHSSSIKEAG